MSDDEDGNLFARDDSVDPFSELDDLDPDTETDPDELFVDMGAVDVADEDVWDELTADEDEPAAEVDGEDAIVPKQSFCERCEYLSSPPTLSCEHPGTEIVELVDTESFRVKNCPIVEQRQARSKR